jgi:hypothetical protein
MDSVVVLVDLPTWATGLEESIHRVTSRNYNARILGGSFRAHTGPSFAPSSIVAERPEAEHGASGPMAQVARRFG